MSAEILAAHVLYVGADEDGPGQCGCGLAEPDEVHEANDAKASERWWASHVAEAIGLVALLERVEAAEGEAAKLRKGMLEVPPKIATVMGDQVTKLRAELAAVRILHTDKIIAFDALAAKVADAGERIALAIEAEAGTYPHDSIVQVGFREAAALARDASETP